MASDTSPSTIQCLTGRWWLGPDPGNQGRDERWFARGPVGQAEAAPVPGVIQQVFPTYHGVAWYWNTFTPLQKRLDSDQRVLLRFGAVDYLAEVWLNGIHVGGHEGGESPFALDVTNVIRLETENSLVVRVLNPTDARIDGILLAETPHGNKFLTNWQPGMRLDSGGILLPVEVVVVPSLRITDVFARPDQATGRVRLTVVIQNETEAESFGKLRVVIGPSTTAESLDREEVPVDLAMGASNHELTVSVPQPRPWSLDDPYLYRVTADLDANRMGARPCHTYAIRCGFRDFRVEHGYFRLNGKRVFLRSTHTGNHVPIGQMVQIGNDFLRRDLYYAKSAGFNMVRFISGMAYPEQLDLCDELGLMVYEESFAGWLMSDSPQMAERFERSTREMVLRDRNHPSLTIWGMLNETWDGPVFSKAVEALSLVRSFDDTRLVLLNSGRFDGHWEIGSVSNPGSNAWEHVWGAEAPGATPVLSQARPPHWTPPAYLVGAGDAHAYPRLPQTDGIDDWLRSLGNQTKPVFLSEYGIGSLMNVVRELRSYEQAGARSDLFDEAVFRSFVDRLEADWRRFGCDDVYPFIEDMLRESQRLHSRQRLRGLDLIRSNPKLCGYNLTGMLDHAITGEGVWTFWREWKPGIVDALADGFASLRWCLFASPGHGYIGRSVKLEAVLANEDVLPPGEYPVSFRISGPSGVVWERRMSVRIPAPADGEDGSLAVPVLSEEIVLDGPPGSYVFAANLDRGGAPAGGRLSFIQSDRAELPLTTTGATLWGVDEPTSQWLRGQGVVVKPFERKSDRREVVLVGGQPGGNGADWRDLVERISRGSVAIFLQPGAFRRDEDPVGWLPLSKKGRCYLFNNWLYHKEDVIKRHSIMSGLPSGGVLDWEYYGQVTPLQLFDGQDTPDEVVVASFAPAYHSPGSPGGFATGAGYESGISVGVYRIAAGKFVVNTMRILENLDHHPAADRLLLNLINYAARFVDGPLVDPPADFTSRLMSIGYQP